MKHLRYLFILLVVFTLPTYAQVELENIEDDDDSNVADSAMIDTLQNDSVALPWPQGIQQKLAKLVKSDMFKTSQLGMMVYDLDADSTIFAFNDKQLMRPASTMKLITAITAIDKLGGDYQFKT